MSEIPFRDGPTRRNYLRGAGVLGASLLGASGAARIGKADPGPGEKYEGETLYAPPEGTPVPGAMYPRVERLEERPGCGRGGETLLATFENYPSMSGGAEPYFPIYRSTNGGETWEKFSEIHDRSGKCWGLRYQPTLYELPESAGCWPAGTVLAAGNSIPILDDPSTVPDGEIGTLGETSIDLYASTDRGRSWEFVSTVVTGGTAVPHAGNSPVWEPELQLDADGNLVCYFADERQGSDDGYNQLVGLKASTDGGETWGEEEFVTAIPNGVYRPGMPVVVELPNGGYMAVYEIVGSENVDGEVRVKTSPDGRDWGDPTDLGHPVVTADGRRFINGPYVTWTPRGGPDGTVLVSGKQLVDENRDLAEGNGEVVLANTNLDGSGDWTPVKAPLSFETESELGGRVFVGWTTPILPSKNGKQLLEMTSIAMNSDLCKIQYAERPLKLNKL